MRQDEGCKALKTEEGSMTKNMSELLKVEKARKQELFSTIKNGSDTAP